LEIAMISLPEELQDRVRAEMRGDEKLLWTGQPIPGHFLQSAIPNMLGGIFVTAFAIFWMAGASGVWGGGTARTENLLFSLFGIPFLLFGLGLLTSPFWMCERASRTCYALTNQRAIIWKPGFFDMEVRSYHAPQLNRMFRHDYRDGSGDLIFQDFIMTKDDDGHERATSNKQGFIGIKDVRTVENLIRETLLSESRPA
jgi:hypothetical protein